MKIYMLSLPYMENIEGIISLFIACLELVLLINVIIFAEKNSINKLVIVMILILFSYQVIEFIICYVEVRNSLFTYSAFVIISFLPPLGLKIVLNFYKFRSRLINLLFIPPLFFAFYYPLVITKFEVAKCTVLYASYNYPLGDIYGAFYYLPLLVTILFLVYKQINKDESVNSLLALVILIAFIITAIPTLIIFIFAPDFIDIIESIMCKFAFFVSLAFTFFALKNKQTKIGLENEANA